VRRRRADELSAAAARRVKKKVGGGGADKMAAAAAARPAQSATAWSTLCNGRASVRPSRHSTVAATCGGFAAERPADRTYRSRQRRAPAPSSTALSSKCGQCRVDSRVDEAEHSLVDCAKLRL